METILRRIVALCFCLIIALPIVGTLTGVGTLDSRQFAAKELRQRAAFPQPPGAMSELRVWTEGFNAWFNDQYAFRQHLIRAYAGMLYVGFGQSGFPKQVLVGQEGFLFLGDNHSQIMSTHAGVPTWREEDAVAAVRNVENMRRWFAERNIQFIFTIAPDKYTIYQEYLPTWIRSPNKNLPAARMRALAREQGLRELHYEPEMLQRNKGEYGADLYWAADTHWTQLGAFLYYKDMLRQLNTTQAESFKTLPDAAYTFNISYSGDLSGFLGSPVPQRNPIFDDSAWPPLPVYPVSSGLPEAPDSRRAILKSVYKNPYALNPQKILMFGDSFTSNHLHQLFVRSFQSVLAFSNAQANAIFLEAIEVYQPDVVVFEVVERDSLSYLQTILADVLMVKSSGQDGVLSR